MLDCDSNLLILTSNELPLVTGQDLVYDTFPPISIVDTTINNVIDTAIEN